MKVVSECPVNNKYTIPSTVTLNFLRQPHDEWINLAKTCLDPGTTDDCSTWKSFFKNGQKDCVDETLPDISSILPLFHEKTVTPAMVKYARNSWQ